VPEAISIADLAALSGWAGSGNSRTDWRSLEAQYSVSFPAEYKDFVGRFPPGFFRDFLSVLHPCGAAAVPGALSDLPFLCEYFGDPLMADPSFPFTFWPHQRGLVPWGSMDVTLLFCWDLSGVGDVRTVVCSTSDWRIFNGGMLAALTAFMRGEDFAGGLTPTKLLGRPARFRPLATEDLPAWTLEETTT